MLEPPTLQLPLPFRFHADQTFVRYHAGPNEQAVNSLRECAGGSGENLIYLWGETGLGKTHLVHACCHQAYRRGCNPAYLPLKQLGPYGPRILEGQDTIPLVCIDDIEAIAGRRDWEDGLFDFFNRSRDSGNRLIVTARQPPSDSTLQCDGLSSRLAWGLTVRLRPLGDDDRLAAVMLRAGALGLEIKPEVGRFLLTRYARDPASLWHLLERLDRATLAAQRKLTIPFVRSYLERIP